MSAKQAGGGQADNSASIIWGIAVIFAAIGVIWYIFKDYIVYAYFLIKLYEVDLLNLVTNGHYAQLHETIQAALAHPKAVTFPLLIAIGSAVGEWLRFPFAALLFILAIVVYLGNATRVFKRIYSIKELARSERGNWPQISPVIDIDLIKTDIDKGPWAMAMTPMQFCKKFRLLEEVRPQRREGMTRKDWDKIEVILKRGEANKLFALQLGGLWRGTDKLPPHIKALFAVFAARINADSQGAAQLIRQMNESCLGKLDFSGTDDLLKKHENTKLVQQIVQSHAYIYTVMAGMLEGARDDGVQASADFLWLKPYDRRLWYVLNTVGRQTPFVEVAGPFAHWIAEKEAGRKLIVPMVEEASKALELALKDVVYKPDETESA